MTSTGSTNQDVLRAFRNGDSPQSILADHQTAGRGRLGRVWHNDRSRDPRTTQSMLGSVPQTWGKAEAGLSLVPFVAGLAAVDAAGLAVKVTGRDGVALSWPNDVVALRGGQWRKLAGILVESHPISERAIGVAVGVGMNLAPVRHSSDEAVTTRAISLSELTSAEIPHATDVFAVFCNRLAYWTERLRRDRAVVMAHYRERCCTIGRPVEVQLVDELLIGKAVDVADSGELIVDRSGQHLRITVGDVVIRPS